MKKCKCNRFKDAVEDGETRGRVIMENCPKCNSEIMKIPKTIEYSLCVVEGIESRIFYCPWCGGLL